MLKIGYVWILVQDNNESIKRSLDFLKIVFNSKYIMLVFHSLEKHEISRAFQREMPQDLLILIALPISSSKAMVFLLRIPIRHYTDKPSLSLVSYYYLNMTEMILG